MQIKFYIVYVPTRSLITSKSRCMKNNIDFTWTEGMVLEVLHYLRLNNW